MDTQELKQILIDENILTFEKIEMHNAQKLGDEFLYKALVSFLLHKETREYDVLYFYKSREGKIVYRIYDTRFNDIENAKLKYETLSSETVQKLVNLFR